MCIKVHSVYLTITGEKKKLRLNLGRTENNLSQVMETQMTVNDKGLYSSLITFTGKEFLKLACD
jgi:2C-methyl-D-erythritol 2,4-cyclodiphosphate synthase